MRISHQLLMALTLVLFTGATSPGQAAQTHTAQAQGASIATGDVAAETDATADLNRKSLQAAQDGKMPDYTASSSKGGVKAQRKTKAKPKFVKRTKTRRQNGTVKVNKTKRA